MNVEALDGFFAALIAGPETVMPSEYYREVFGGEMSDACEFSSLEEANEILGLMMRHWNTIAGTLFKGEVYVPLLLEDEHGVAHGNDWARGFMRGMHMRHDGWAELVNDEEHGGCLIPMMMLCHEHDEDPEMRPKPITPEKREDIIVHMAAGLVGAYRYFREHRKAYAGSASAPEPRSTTSKVGRNDPCPVRFGKEIQEVLRRGDGELNRPFLPNHQRCSALDRIPGEGIRALGSQWENSHQQSYTATARRSPTRPPPTVGGGATGSTRTVPSLPGKLSMPDAATNTASRCGTPTSVHASSNRASTARSRPASTG